MKTSKLFALVTATVMSLSGAGVALAQGEAARGGDQTDPRMQDPLALYKMAGINTDQEEQIRSLAKEFENTQRVRVKSLVALYQQLKQIQLQPDPPEDQAIAKQEEINKLTGEMSTDRIKLLLKVRKVLTPDQRKKLIAIMTEEPAQSGAPKEPAAPIETDSDN
ncbi:MAG: hypothetical protein SGJ27_19675 [Candidatus Melainabacteria bacterium]|nr:hypothetical protein [Candidatus Melainabacteria bacterium]